MDVSTCDYLMDSFFPLHSETSRYEPAYAADTDNWDRVKCLPFLDARHSSLLTRALWMPGQRWQRLNNFGEICLLKHNENIGRKEKELAVHKN